MKHLNYIVELEEGVWICEMEGDPGRTLVRESAQKFDTFQEAKRALSAARKFKRKFPKAVIESVYTLSPASEVGQLSDECDEDLWESPQRPASGKDR